jgi:hypothetical protein
MTPKKMLQKIRFLLTIVIIGLALSGITAFPLRYELNLINNFLTENNSGPLNEWINRVTTAVNEIDATYPFLSYGTDWLAFAHIMIALVFLGPLKDPVQNRWVIDWGLIASVGVIPLAMIAGPIREIPFFHRLIDCAFGVISFALLFYCRKLIQRLPTKPITISYE